MSDYREVLIYLLAAVAIVASIALGGLWLSARQDVAALNYRMGQLEERFAQDSEVRTGAQALQAAQASQACCDATNEKIDRIFKRSESP